MSVVATSVCPECGANIIYEYRETRFTYSDNMEVVDEREHAWTVECENGHVHDVVARLAFDPYWRLKSE